ncbi:MAG: hypothetical protein HC888_05425 [Candidatus Competibacteraceae bacterium]|nr:hypothetical protein [Candidatus Competibacteraceae bacterium]
MKSIHYHVGGTMPAKHPYYVTRPADAELLDSCRSGTFAYILSPRQVGKSSLRVRTVDQLHQEGVLTAEVELNAIGVQDVTYEQWYLGVIRKIIDDLALPETLESWWRTLNWHGYAERLVKFFEQALKHHPAKHIVIFIDEIDNTLALSPGFADDFFAAIRYVHNEQRALNAALGRLSFVVIGVAQPQELIADSRRTPFNNGRRINLGYFTHDEASIFTRGFNLVKEERTCVLERVLYWTMGTHF